MNHPFAHAALLGILQGVADALPISSSGHVALLSIVFGVTRPTPLALALASVAVDLAGIVCIWRRAQAALREGFMAFARPARLVDTLAGRDALLVLLVALPAAVVSASVGVPTAPWSQAPGPIGLGLLATAAVLLSTAWLRPGARAQPSWFGASFLTVAQFAAFVPGLSRGACTLSALLWLGVRRERAFELALLVSLPVTSGALLFTASEAVWNDGAPLLFGFVMAFATGFPAFLVLRWCVLRWKIVWFAVWVLPLALATLAMARAWP